MNELKENYENAVSAYLNEFLKMYDFDILDAWWTAGEVGEVIGIGDYFFGFHDIMLCVDRQVEWDELSKWYDYSMDASTYGFISTNLKSWLAGCPRKSDEEINAIREKQAEIEAMKKLLTEMCRENENLY